MNSILDQYHVQFSTPIGYAFYNSISTINETMSGIIQEHYSIDTATGFLDGINSVLNDESVGEIEFNSLFLSLAVVAKATTNIYNVGDNYYDNPSIIPDFSLPTVDFQAIVAAWLNYITQSSVTPQI